MFDLELALGADFETLLDSLVLQGCENLGSLVYSRLASLASKSRCRILSHLLFVGSAIIRLRHVHRLKWFGD